MDMMETVDFDATDNLNIYERGNKGNQQGKKMKKADKLPFPANELKYKLREIRKQSEREEGENDESAGPYQDDAVDADNM